MNKKRLAELAGIPEDTIEVGDKVLALAPFKDKEQAYDTDYHYATVVQIEDDRALVVSEKTRSRNKGISTRRWWCKIEDIRKLDPDEDSI